MATESVDIFVDLGFSALALTDFFLTLLSLTYMHIPHAWKSTWIISIFDDNRSKHGDINETIHQNLWNKQSIQ